MRVDPQLALYGFIGAIQEGADETADEYYEALSTWLRSGGFEPNWSESEKRLFYNFKLREEIADERDADDWANHAE